MLKRLLLATLGTMLAASALAQAALSEGEVRKVDKAIGKVTLRHGEIKNLDMPPMTMVFGVKDKSLLAGLKAGEKVLFAADKDAAGQYVITAIEPRK